MKNKTRLFYVLLTIVIVLTGCSEQKQTDPPVPESQQSSEHQNIEVQEDVTGTPSQGEALNEIETSGEIMDTSHSANSSKAIIQLEEGKTVEAFIPDGWQLLDAIDLDFNKDGFMDKIGVLEANPENVDQEVLYDSPRVLFALENINNASFKLNFQEVNLIRNEFEGGVFGDPYFPMTVEGNNFSTHTYGGSSWRWSEDLTFSYKDGEWYLIASEETYGQGGYLTTIIKNDYERRIGTRSYNSENSEEMMQREMDYMPFDVSFELSLESPPRLEEYSATRLLESERLPNQEIDQVLFSDALELTREEKDVLENSAKKMMYIFYTDQEYIAYTFESEVNQYEYLVIYNKASKTSTVVDQYEKLERDWLPKFNNVKLYNDRIYYNGYDSEVLEYTDSEGQKRTSNAIVSSYLYSEGLDGTDKRILFKYENKLDEMGNSPYIVINFEIHSGEIIFYTYTEQAVSYYKMNLDGGDVESLGSIKN